MVAAIAGTPASRPAAGPVRVVRLGQVIPVRDQDTDGEVYLLSYAHTAAGPQLSVLAPARLTGRHRRARPRSRTARSSRPRTGPADR